MKLLPDERWFSKKLLSGKKKPGLWNWENHLTPSFTTYQLGSVQFSSVTQSCPTLCDPMDYSTLGFPVHHQLLELTQTHVHWVGDAIQPSRPLSSPSPPSIFPRSRSFLMSQFFASGCQSIVVATSASVLPMHIQSWFPLGLTDWSPCSPRDSQESSPTTQFKSINSSALSFHYGPTLTSIHDCWKTRSFD